MTATNKAIRLRREVQETPSSLDVTSDTLRAALRLPTRPRPMYEDHGERFASRIELERWRELRVLQAAGEIAALVAHPTYRLAEPYVDRWGKKYSGIVYTPDFGFVENGISCVEEVKVVRFTKLGRRVTPTEYGETRLRYGLFARAFPAIRLRVTYREMPKGGR